MAFPDITEEEADEHLKLLAEVLESSEDEYENPGDIPGDKVDEYKEKLES